MVDSSLSPAHLGGVTLQDVLEHTLVPLSERTRVKYSGDLARWVRHCAEQGRDPLEAQPHHVDEWVTRLHRQGASASYLRELLGPLRRFYRVARALGATQHDISDRIPHRLQPPTSLTTREADRLLDLAAQDGPHTELAISLLLAGMPVITLRAARIEHAVERPTGAAFVYPLGAVLAEIPLTPRAKTALELCRREASTGPVLADSDGQPCRHYQVLVLVRRLGDAAGMPFLVPTHLNGRSRRR